MPFGILRKTSSQRTGLVLARWLGAAAVFLTVNRVKFPLHYTQRKSVNLPSPKCFHERPCRRGFTPFECSNEPLAFTGTRLFSLSPQCSALMALSQVVYVSGLRTRFAADLLLTGLLTPECITLGHRPSTAFASCRLRVAYRSTRLTVLSLWDQLHHTFCLYWL